MNKNVSRVDATPNLLGFEGRSVVVTGGGSGIGAACARLLGSRGARVFVADRDAEAAVRIAEECDGIAVTVDVGDADSIAAMVELVHSEVDAVDGLVTCAGIMPGRLDRVPDVTLPEWKSYFDVNVHGTYSCVAAFGQRMASRGRGSIVTIASVTASRSTPLNAYGCSKAAVVQMARNLASEWGRSGVRINSISPGYVLTEGLRRAIASGHRDADRIRESSAMGRIVEPLELARAAAFLLSDEAAVITGVDLPVDAGWHTAATWTFYGGVPQTQVNHS